MKITKLKMKSPEWKRDEIEFPEQLKKLWGKEAQGPIILKSKLWDERDENPPLTTDQFDDILEDSFKFAQPVPEDRAYGKYTATQNLYNPGDYVRLRGFDDYGGTMWTDNDIIIGALHKDYYNEDKISGFGCVILLSKSKDSPFFKKYNPFWDIQREDEGAIFNGYVFSDAMKTVYTQEGYKYGWYANVLPEFTIENWSIIKIDTWTNIFESVRIQKKHELMYIKDGGQMEEAKIIDEEQKEIAPAAAEDVLTSMFKTVIEQKIETHFKNKRAELWDHFKDDVVKVAREVTKGYRQIEIKIPNGEKVKLDRQHKEFDNVLKVALVKIPIMLVGPAGSGKTTLASNIAKALTVEFHPQSVGLQTTKSDLIGYMDAVGKYVASPLRKAYEFGGVYLMDEIDAGNANVITILNACIANDVASFPDQVIARHKDFIIISAANTFGRGSDRQYVGRNQLDAATLDRFAVINFDYDEDFERHLAGNDKWVNRVQGYRHAVFNLKERIVISPRASIFGASLLTQGFKDKEVEDLVIFKGINSDIKKKIVSTAKERIAELDSMIKLVDEKAEALSKQKQLALEVV